MADAVISPAEPPTPGAPGGADLPLAFEAHPPSVFGPVESWAVTVVLLAMSIAPVIQALLRKTLHVDLPGSSIWVQHGTLWVGFLGALIATGRGKHLGLSTVEFLPKRFQLPARILGAMVTTAVVALLAVAAFHLVMADRQRTDTLAGGIPTWCSEVIMPVVFALMALRTAWLAPGGWVGRIASVVAAGIGFSLVAFQAHPEMLTWPVIAIVLLAFLFGAPVFVAMAGISMMLFFSEGTPIASVPTETFNLVASATLPAIPLLTLAGYVLSEGGSAKRLVSAFQALFGWMPGGLAVMVACVCAVFTTFTGASGVTILALGGLVFPALLREGYPEGFSLGLVTASGSLGLLLPPSLPVILYAVVAQVAIKDLYIAGLVPGLILILVVAAYGVFIGAREKVPRQKFVPSAAVKSLWNAKWDLGMPALMVGAVVTGFSTIVEAAALAAVYSLFVEIVVFREIKIGNQLAQVMSDAATLVGAVLILLGVALGLTSYLVDAMIPQQLLGWVQIHLHSQWAFLLALNGLLLVLGSVLEIYSAIVVLAPLVVPMGKAFGVDPLHLGVVFLANLELGFLFPPMGLNLFLSAQRFGKPLPELYKRAFPFLVILAVGVLLITYVPAVTTGVVDLIGRSH